MEDTVDEIKRLRLEKRNKILEQENTVLIEEITRLKKENRKLEEELKAAQYSWDDHIGPCTHWLEDFE